MKQSGNDNYDLNTSSPQGHAGFEPFRTDKHFYFHFNDEAGDCILFSQAYKTKKGCDNGMVSIRKNIKKKAHLILHHDDDLHYFTIKAGNNQEVARSRNYESKEEMATSIEYLYQHLGVTYNTVPKGKNNQQIIKALKADLTEKKTIEKELREKLWELESALAETSSSLNESLLQKEIWIKEKAGLEEKLVILAKRSSDLAESKRAFGNSKNDLEDIPTTNFSFRINFYHVDNKETVKMAIYHPMTKDRKILTGFDKEAMIAFMVSKLPSTILPPTPDKMEKELDATKITETVFVTQDVSNHNLTPVQKTVIFPSIKEENKQETAQKEKEETINLQMKALVEATKSSNMSIPNPAITLKESAKPQAVNTVEELAIINKFFRQEVEIAPTTNIKVEEKIEANVNNIESTEIYKEKITYTAEELTTINKFFGQVAKDIPTEKIPTEKEIATSLHHLKREKINTVEEEKIIQQFFPKVEKPLRENIALAENSADFLDAFISKTRDQKNSPIVEVLDITINSPSEMDKAAEITLIEQFFPSTTQLKKEKEIAVQIEIDKLLDEVSVESEQKSLAEVELINKFFTSEVKKEKILLPKPLHLNIFPVETIAESQKTKQATIEKFFGENFQKTVDKNSTSETVFKPAKEEDIRLYNKFFGKNIPIKNANNCCS